MALIELRQVAKTFRMGLEEIHALDGVSLSIQTGEFVSIVGASGSGKSTMMNILGLLDTPSKGEYLFNGRPVQSLTDDERAQARNQNIGFVFQSFHLLPRMTALRNVEMPLVYASSYDHSSTPQKMNEMAIDAMARVGLADRMTHRPNELSGGQRQRVAIARALVNRPHLILADEPTGNLDSRVGGEILKLFEDLNSTGVTVVLVTHDPKVAERAKRVISMADGKVVSDVTA